MGRRTVTECDGCGGVPDDPYPWISVSYGDRDVVTVCSAFCTNVVLDRWNVARSPLVREGMRPPEREVESEFGAEPADGGKGKAPSPPEAEQVRDDTADRPRVRNPFTTKPPVDAEAEALVWVADRIGHVARFLAEVGRDARAGR